MFYLIFSFFFLSFANDDNDDNQITPIFELIFTIILKNYYIIDILG